MVGEWQALRIVLAEIEAAEHPDVTDAKGRVWVWWKGDLYRHESKAWPRDFIQLPESEGAMPEVSSTETEAQTRTRSALGGFERDAKTFEGHLQRITASAEAFVKRCAKFAISEPDHPRLAETAELLAEAKRIIGKSEPAPTFTATLVADPDLDWRVQWHALAERVRQLEAEVFADDAKADAALVAGESHETGIADGITAKIEAIDMGPVTAVDPLANLAPGAAARVQAAIDQAAAKRAELVAAAAAAAAPVPPINPFAGAILPVTEMIPPTLVNPFAGLGT